MQIVCSGKGLVIGSSFRERVEQVLAEAVTKYFPNAVSAHIVFSKDRSYYNVDLTINDGTGRGIIKGSASEHNIEATFEKALSKIEKQLSKYHSKITDWSKRKAVSEYSATKRLFISEEEENDIPLEDEYFEQTDQRITSEYQLEVERLSTAEAVMNMDLLGVQSLLFINSSNGAVSMVYRRGKDIALVETTLHV